MKSIIGQNAPRLSPDMYLEQLMQAATRNGVIVIDSEYVPDSSYGYAFATFDVAQAGQHVIFNNQDTQGYKVHKIVIRLGEKVFPDPKSNRWEREAITKVCWVYPKAKQQDSSPNKAQQK